MRRRRIKRKSIFARTRQSRRQGLEARTGDGQKRGQGGPREHIDRLRALHPATSAEGAGLGRVPWRSPKYPNADANGPGNGVPGDAEFYDRIAPRVSAAPSSLPHESAIQRAVREAVTQGGYAEKGEVPTHSAYFATHCWRTVTTSGGTGCEHEDDLTNVLNRGPAAVRSPADNGCIPS